MAKHDVLRAYIGGMFAVFSFFPLEYLVFQSVSATINAPYASCLLRRGNLFDNICFFSMRSKIVSLRAYNRILQTACLLAGDLKLLVAGANMDGTLAEELNIAYFLLANPAAVWKRQAPKMKRVNAKKRKAQPQKTSSVQLKSEILDDKDAALHSIFTIKLEPFEQY